MSQIGLIRILVWSFSRNFLDFFTPNRSCQSFLLVIDALRRSFGELQRSIFYLSVFFVEVEFSLEIGEMSVMVMVHHWVGVEQKLEVDAAGIEGDLGVAFAAPVGEAKFSLFLRTVAESCVANLQAKQPISQPID